MDEITPENVQEKINLFQQMQQQSQALTQQISQIDVTIAETERTLNELKGATKKNTIYRAIGSVMKKIDDVSPIYSNKPWRRKSKIRDFEKRFSRILQFCNKSWVRCYWINVYSTFR